MSEFAHVFEGVDELKEWSWPWGKKGETGKQAPQKKFGPSKSQINAVKSIVDLARPDMSGLEHSDEEYYDVLESLGGEDAVFRSIVSDPSKAAAAFRKLAVNSPSIAAASVPSLVELGARFVSRT